MEVAAENNVADLKSFLEQAAPIFDLIPDAVRVVDLEGVSHYVNRAFLQMTGYSMMEILNRPLFDLYVDEDKPRAQTALSVAYKTGQWSGTFEARMRRKGGEPVMVSLNAGILRNSKNEMIGGFAVFRDVSRMERILAEPIELLNLTGSPVEVLRQLPARVATFYPGRPWVMINLVEGDYLRFAYAMNVPAELMAQGGEPLAGSICGMVIETSQFIGIGDMASDDRTRQDPCVTQYGCRGYLGYPIFHSSGKILGTICVLRPSRGGFGEYDHRILQMFAKRASMEIERMELETEIAQSEKEMQELIEHAPLIMWRISPEGRFVMISSKGRKELGYGAHERLRETWFDLVHPEDLPEIQSQIAAAVSNATNGLFSAPVRLKRRDGSYGRFFTTIRPVRDSSGNVKLLEGVTFEIPAAD